MNFARALKQSKDAPAARKASARNLRIAGEDDAFEQQANRAAEDVLAGGKPGAAWSLFKLQPGVRLQRKCSCGGSGECEECKKEKLQRKAAGPAGTDAVAPPIVHEELQSPGHPLDAGTRSFMEARFGHDFGRVRVHTSAGAAASARAVNALAYTVGNDVVFGQGQYAPQSSAGRSLIAHELTHTLQQAEAPKAVPARLPIGPVRDDREWEAEQNALGLAPHIPVPRPAPVLSVPVLRRLPAACSVEVCFLSIEKYKLGRAGFRHSVINFDDGGGVKHVEVDPDFHQPKGFLHSHVVSGAGRKGSDECQTLPATCADAAKILPAANEYESRDAIYDPFTKIGPNSNSFAEWTLAKAGFTASRVNIPFGGSGWDYFTNNPAERTDPPHVLRTRATLPASPKTASGGACTKVFAKANNPAEYIALVREAEARMAAAGITGNPEKIKILRGLYYGTPWSVDFGDQASASRIAGFQAFTASGVKFPRDPVSLFDCGLYQALQVSQDVPGKSGPVDMGHVMIALDARNSTLLGVAAPNRPFPGFGGSGTEIVTWLGDLGGGAASLAIERAKSPGSPANVSKKFTGTDYGSPSNLEGDVAGFLVARGSGVGSPADVPAIAPGKGIADALDDYFATTPKASTAAWDQRAKTFLTLYGGAFDAAGNLTNSQKLIDSFSDQIESFACEYLAQRKTDSSASISDQEFLDAADHIRSCSKEVAQTFVNILEDVSKTPGVTLKALRAYPSPTPAAPGACRVMTTALRVNRSVQKVEQKVEQAGQKVEHLFEQGVKKVKEVLPF